jgi:hypothetical protein
LWKKKKRIGSTFFLVIRSIAPHRGLPRIERGEGCDRERETERGREGEEAGGEWGKINSPAAAKEGRSQIKDHEWQRDLPNSAEMSSIGGGGII